MGFPRCTANGDARGSDRTVCSGIAATTQPPFGAVSGRVTSCPVLAKRRTEHGSGLGRWRWVVERTFAWLSQFRRLRVRYDKRADIHEAFLALGCALVCWQFLRKGWMAG
jgi:transposase